MPDDVQQVTLHPESGANTPTGIGRGNGGSKDVDGVGSPTDWGRGGGQNWRTRPTTLPAMRNSPLPSVTTMGSKASFSGMRRMPSGSG